MRTLKALTSQGKRVIKMAYSCDSETLDELRVETKNNSYRVIVDE